jgi:hypothetical protein
MQEQEVLKDTLNKTLMEATIKETALKDMEATLHKTLLEATMKESTLQESIKSVRLTMISNQIG